MQLCAFHEKAIIRIFGRKTKYGDETRTRIFPHRNRSTSLLSYRMTAGWLYFSRICKPSQSVSNQSESTMVYLFGCACALPEDSRSVKVPPTNDVSRIMYVFHYCSAVNAAGDTIVETEEHIYIFIYMYCSRTLLNEERDGSPISPEQEH